MNGLKRKVGAAWFAGAFVFLYVGLASVAALEPLATFDETVEAMAVSPVDPRTVFVLAGEKFLTSSDGGRTWKAVDAPSLLSGDRILIPDAASRLGLFLLSGSQNSQFAPGRLYRSRDGGATWTPLAQTIPDLQITSFAQNAGDPATLYLADASGVLYVSKDFGATWLGVEGSRFRGMKVGSIATFAKAPRTLFVTAAPWASHCPCGDVYRSTDGGANWEKIVPVIDEKTGREKIPGVIALRYSPKDAAVVWGVEAYLAIVTRDGGNSWKELQDAVDDRVAALQNVFVDPDDAQTVYIFNAAIRRSRGGEKWEIVAEAPAPVVGMAIRPLDKKTKQVVFAAGKALYVQPPTPVKK